MAQAAEELGASLPAWPMFEHIAWGGGLDTLVEPSVMEMHPLLQWGTHEWEEHDKPLMLLEWIDPADCWRHGEAMCLHYAVEETTNTYKEGWWSTGDKGVLKGGRYNIWSPEGFEMTEILDASSTPPLPLSLPDS
eukprot:3940332-Rhodomonas_salina.4